MIGTDRRAGLEAAARNIQLRGGARPVRSLPPVDLLPEPLQPLAVRYNDLRAEWSALGGTIQELEQTARQAQERDDVAYAAAIREGKKDPGRKAEEKASAELAEARRRRRAIGVAIEQLAEEIKATIDQGGAWRAEFDREMGEARAGFAAAIEQTRAARGRLQDLENLAGWVEAWPLGDWRGFVARVGGVQNPNGEAVRWPEVLDALAQ